MILRFALLGQAEDGASDATRTGNISYLVQEQAKSASFKVRAKQENMSGVVLPAFEVDRAPGTGTYLAIVCDDRSSRHLDFNITGLGRGGQQVIRFKGVYAKAVETLVELASLEAAFIILDEVSSSILQAS